MPSLVDSTTATISSNADHLLLEGPLSVPQHRKNDNSVPLPGDHVYLGNVDTVSNDYQSLKSEKSIVSLGHYKVPAEYKIHPQQPLQITGRSDPVIHVPTWHYYNSSDPPLQLNTSNEIRKSSNWTISIKTVYNASKNWLNQQENKGLKLTLIILVGCIIAMFWYLNAQFKEFQQLSQGSRENSRTSDSGRFKSLITAEDVGEGLVKVGKITFDTSQVLGKGCEGTFVYKGEFDGRSVAVKRLLPDCFTFADREVALLRESDAHANVVRYFCTEQDRMFRYIALELAEATLQDYVTGRYDRDKIAVKNILRQATSGLAHLHLLDIVHRDIKPHNVLLSAPGPRGEIRAMISDFGLCKKLQLGRVSFSRRSGVTGTDGWIAPEMLNGDRTTCAVDIFSLGCVFYYVLSEGKHPFGDPLRRQANILCGESNLLGLQTLSDSDRQLALTLIQAMIADDPTKRPPASAVHDYPIFWESVEILEFLQDVSDRVEKDLPHSPALMALETGSDRVVHGDWRAHIDAEIAFDLRKYRSYRGDSLRDLLRALRNKKHHYRELSPQAQTSLGQLPDQFTEYWLSRFPQLLCHVWCAMQSFRDEFRVRNYYHAKYSFTYAQLLDFSNNEFYVPCPVPAPEIHGNWRTRDPVDWKPNKARYRGHRQKQEKKKVEEPITWILPAS